MHWCTSHVGLRLTASTGQGPEVVKQNGFFWHLATRNGLCVGSSEVRITYTWYCMYIIYMSLKHCWYDTIKREICTTITTSYIYICILIYHNIHQWAVTDLDFCLFFFWPGRSGTFEAASSAGTGERGQAGRWGASYQWHDDPPIGLQFFPSQRKDAYRNQRSLPWSGKHLLFLSSSFQLSYSFNVSSPGGWNRWVKTAVSASQCRWQAPAERGSQFHEQRDSTWDICL